MKTSLPFRLIVAAIFLTLGKWSFAQTATPTLSLTPTFTVTPTRAPIYKVGAIQANNSAGMPVLGSDGSPLANISAGAVDLYGSVPRIGLNDGVNLKYDRSTGMFTFMNGPSVVWEMDADDGYSSLFNGCIHLLPSTTYVHYGSNMNGVPSVRVHDGGSARISMDNTTGSGAGDIYFLQSGNGLAGGSITSQETVRFLQAGGIKFVNDAGLYLTFSTTNNTFSFGSSTYPDLFLIDSDDGTTKWYNTAGSAVGTFDPDSAKTLNITRGNGELCYYGLLTGTYAGTSYGSYIRNQVSTSSQYQYGYYALVDGATATGSAHIGVNGTASNGMSNTIGVYGQATGSAGGGYLAGVRASNSMTTSGTKYGMLSASTGANGTNVGLGVSASMGTTNKAIDATAGDVCIADTLNVGPGSALTISSNAVTATKSRHSITASGASDTLNTINGGVSGDILYLTGTAGKTITVADGAGNIECNTNRTLDGVNDWMTLMYDGSKWQMLSIALDN